MEANRPQLTCSVTEMALMLGISRSKAYACMRTGEVKSIRIGRRVVVPRRVIDELLGSGAEVESAAAAAESAAERDEGGVKTADLLHGGFGQADPGEDVEHADGRALHSGVLGSDLRQRVGEDDQRRLARKRTRRRQKAVEAGGAGVVSQLLATGPVITGQLSLFDAEGGPHVGRREVEDGEVLDLRPSDPAADLEGRDLVEAQWRKSSAQAPRSLKEAYQAPGPPVRW